MKILFVLKGRSLTSLLTYTYTSHYFRFCLLNQISSTNPLYLTNKEITKQNKKKHFRVSPEVLVTSGWDQRRYRPVHAASAPCCRSDWSVLWPISAPSRISFLCLSAPRSGPPALGPQSGSLGQNALRSFVLYTGGKKRKKKQMWCKPTEAHCCHPRKQNRAQYHIITWNYQVILWSFWC